MWSYNKLFLIFSIYIFWENTRLLSVHNGSYSLFFQIRQSAHAIFQEIWSLAFKASHQVLAKGKLMIIILWGPTIAPYQIPWVPLRG